MREHIPSGHRPNAGRTLELPDSLAGTLRINIDIMAGLYACKVIKKNATYGEHIRFMGAQNS